MNKSLQVTLIGILGAIVTLVSLTLSHLFRFYPLEYLVFDPAEIIVILSLFLFGPLVAIGIAFIHFILLNVGSQFPIIGPFMKFLAVVSTILGIYLGISFSRFRKTFYAVIFAIFLALFIRNAVMTLANYVVFLTVFAPFLFYAENLIAKATGIPGSLLLILIFTVIYNSIHVLISVIPAYYLIQLPQLIKLAYKITIPWIKIKLKEHK